MSLFADVQNFVQEANRLAEIDELGALLGKTVKDLGFDYFALVHHVNIYHTRDKVVHLFDYPAAWTEMIDRNSYFTDDPVHMACQKSAAPFEWSDVRNIVKLTEKHEHILHLAEEAGLGAGFTVPIHVPGEATGSCSFSTKRGKIIPVTTLPAAHYVGTFAFEAARRVSQRMAQKRGVGPMTGGIPRLTRRQLDCVVLAGRGKSDRDVAQILGISDQTVHQHIEDAKRKYDVATRMQLIVRALFDNHLSFADLVG